MVRQWTQEDARIPATKSLQLTFSSDQEFRYSSPVILFFDLPKGNRYFLLLRHLPVPDARWNGTAIHVKYAAQAIYEIVFGLAFKQIF